MAKVKTKLPSTDAVIRGCLDKIRRKEMTAVGVLADHLDEIKHPLAKRVRADFQRAEAGIRWTYSAEWSDRNRLTRWEHVAIWRRWLWDRIMKHFGRKWHNGNRDKRLELTTFK